KIRDYWYTALQTGKPSSVEMRIKDKDGNYRWILNRIVPVKNAQGEIVKWYGSGTDIDHIKRIEQDLKGALSVRDEFISLASHELKTPITSLSLLLELTQRSLRKSKVVDKYMDRALRELRRLRFLVDELLDVSKMSVGKMDVHFEEYDFCKIVYEVLERYQNDPRIQEIITPFKEHTPIIIECDKFRMEQVVTNIISNALKYGEEKPIEVSISEDQDIVTFSVRDFGLGISEENHKKIFERFERVVSQRGISGLGVGLYICKSIIDVHRGEIIVESAIGEGSTFKIKLWKKINHESHL
ncbi:MAG TPA: PAS domain-containing sensor histidine kinase, partial [Bacteriovoracaceae bacterium]|nr:PAS domain-containing sensor histidine kinase [Bacteriovoracaceae bacterium]